MLMALFKIEVIDFFLAVTLPCGIQGHTGQSRKSF